MEVENWSGFMNNLPRRRVFEKMTDAEKSLYNSIVEIEKMPANPKLTEAQRMVMDAMEIVSDFVDGKTMEVDCNYSKVVD